ncbi:hypothetical protein BGX21_000725 [Mortierella sp. AD011]|nr:hypothetical protein BGX20_011660 [Mortierella sp. AD010]KAF9386699.1 hypothetical protein BGX21_000725 [Mortierella sp. AD011]
MSISAPTLSLPASEQHSQNMHLMEGIDADLALMLNNHPLYQQHPLSPTSTSSPPPSHGESQEEEEALNMDLFSQNGFEFGSLTHNSSSIGNLPSPCSPTFDTFQVDGQDPSDSTPVADSDIKALRSSASALMPLTRPLPKPLDLKANKYNAKSDPYLDSSPMTAMSMVTVDSPSPTRPSSPSLFLPSEPSSPSYDEVMLPVVACANCKKSHIKCDHGRPCQNCLKHPNKSSSCRDAVPKQRGRPKGGSKTTSEPLSLRLQHPGFQPFSGGPFLHLHGQPEQPPSHPYGRQRAMSSPHISMQQQQELLLQQHEHHFSQYHYHNPSVEYNQGAHPLTMASWGGNAPGIPEMQAIPTSAGPQPSSQLMPTVGYNAPVLDPYELQQLQQHRQQVQQHLQQPQNASDPHEVAMKRSMSDQFGPHHAPLRHFHNEHHQFLQMQQHHQRQRQHPGSSLTLMIPNPVDGRLVGTSAAGPAFSTSSTMLPPTPISPAHPLHSPTQSYHYHHGHHPIHLSQPPLSPISHGPVPQGHEDATNPTMALLLQQEQEIKQDLEMFEHQGYQKQQELARINLQKLKLQQQQTLERLSQLQQLAHQQEQQNRRRFHRRPSLQIGMSSLQLPSSSGPLAPVHDEEMVDMDA